MCTMLVNNNGVEMCRGNCKCGLKSAVTACFSAVKPRIGTARVSNHTHLLFLVLVGPRFYWGYKEDVFIVSGYGIGLYPCTVGPLIVGVAYAPSS